MKKSAGIAFPGPCVASSDKNMNYLRGKALRESNPECMA